MKVKCGYRFKIRCMPCTILASHQEFWIYYRYFFLFFPGITLNCLGGRYHILEYTIAFFFFSRVQRGLSMLEEPGMFCGRNSGQQNPFCFMQRRIMLSSERGFILKQFWLTWEIVIHHVGMEGWAGVHHAVGMLSSSTLSCFHVLHTGSRSFWCCEICIL